VLLPPRLGVEGAILSDQIRSLDWRVAEMVGKILALVDPDEAR
jgi:hypothetical protein